MAADDILKIETRGKVRLLTLNRPERRNAISVLRDDVTTESLESADPLAFVQDFIGRYRVPDLPGLPRLSGGLP